MIVIERYENTNLWITRSDAGVKIKPVFDRLGKEIADFNYNEAIDIDVDGYPRYDYEETEEVIEQEENEEENNEVGEEPTEEE